MLQPRYYQAAANEAVWKYFSEKSGNCVVVLPTGAGKSLLIAMLIQQALDFGGRVVVLAHRKELLQQNADEIRGMIPGVDVGVYSAGLKKREIHNAVVVAGIQSVFRKGDDLGRRHLILVDEAHLISDLEESMYRRFLGDMQKQEGLRIAGLTATPFRTGTGPICGPDRIFQRIVFESKTSELIQQGFLCPITNKVATSEVNTDSVPLKGGEFVDAEIQAVFGAEDVVKAACLEICDKAHDRHSILVFASGVYHAEQIAEILPGSAVVTGETMPIERAETLRRFVAGELRFLINVDVLTTGFNARNIDAIAILRATMSPGLFCQMVGRGLRLHDSCTNCLLLDFGGNIARHGSIDDENFGASKEQSGGKRGEVAAQNGRGKKCPACELDVAANARSCPECEFIFPVKHEAKSDDESQVTGAMPPEEWIVKDVVFRVHVPKRDADAVVTPSVRVDYVVSKSQCGAVEHECKYQCGSTTGTTRINGPHIELICDGCGKHQKFVPKSDVEQGGNLATTTIAEWICPGHSGFARTKFLAWWDAHSICDPPDNAEDCVELLKLGVCRWPGGIVTKKKGQWFEILEHKWASEKPTTLAEIVEEREFSGEGDDCPF
jgi:DNA repair protein RadD